MCKYTCTQIGIWHTCIAMELAVGEEYSSYQELSNAIRHWEESNFVTLYTRSSRSVEASRKRAPMNGNSMMS